MHPCPWANCHKAWQSARALGRVKEGQGGRPGSVPLRQKPQNMCTKGEGLTRQAAYPQEAGGAEGEGCASVIPHAYTRVMGYGVICGTYETMVPLPPSLPSRQRAACSAF